ncbi:hypothetical protein OK349_15155 [Sphingomonas sp. BT-65]|uniref:hypothetical protein n=1 Tax=Sphingomonas sp. BT-65 TaxID=2989821 RepID=UPI0022368080|nr:hypothetical protein [Sphingomonas sp. BT-65]MCW4463050.1 hypothetical protein [Sphingomonas sp. BT-65]
MRHANGHENGYRVELPRIHDAIGVVLRDAYEREPELPQDMIHLLKQMSDTRYVSR